MTPTRRPSGPAIGRRFLSGWLVALSLLVVGPAYAGDRVDPGTLTGKMLMGYQGWFACPGDGAPLGWGHWGQTRQGQFVAAVDMLPDVTDLAPAQRCDTVMRTAGGQTVDLFSDQRLATVELQFAWMQQYGLDGAAVQRFGSVLGKPPALKAFDTVLANVRHAAQDHGRVFFVMYDLSGMTGRDLPAVAQDWERLLHEGLAGSPAYLRHRGHALVGLWGLGFAGRPITPGDAEALVDALAKASVADGGVTILGGVPSYWRTRAHDAAADPGWDRVWRRLGVISPWSVGRFADDAGADTYRRAVLEPDIAAARALGADYMPVVFPGFSWANLQRDQRAPAKAIRNAIPRRCGRFYWRQVANALASGATMLYGAMFDEVNEGTAMFKTLARASQAPARGVPAGDGFVTLDSDGCNLPSDWYLRLAGAATTALRGGARPSADLPLALPRN